MYGDKITTEYGRTEGRRRHVVGKVDTAPIGNLILESGVCLAPEGAPSQGWEPKLHIVMKPSESAAFLAEALETLLGHEKNEELFDRTSFELSDLNEHGLVGKLKELADDLELAEKETGRDEEVK